MESTHKKYSAKKTILYSFIGLVISVLTVGLITIAERIFILPAFPEFETGIRLIVNILIILSIVGGIYITARLSYKENSSTVIFVSSFFSLVGVIICDMVFNYANFVIPAEMHERHLYFVMLSVTILLIGGLIAIAIKKWIAPAIKELIGKLSGNLNEFIWVSIIGVLTYLPMIIYFNTSQGEDIPTNTQIITRLIFLILYVTIYLMIIFGVRRSMKALHVKDELRLAKEIQTQILPSANALAEIPGVKISALMIPYLEIGGDFYDAFKIDEEKSAFIIADVAGKGIPASLFMMQVKSLLKVNLRMDKIPDYVLTVANYDSLKNKSSMYYGAVVGILETATHKFTYSCGGQFPPVLIRKGSVTECEYMGDPELGITDTVYSQFDIILEKDDVIFYYTDGVLDTVSKNGKFYGKKRLFDIISKETEPDKIISAVIDDINKFSENGELTDDVTMLAFKVL
ncbi:MAG: PP2C family protein-serine/threonine phosphatase [Methanocorpusculum sp.]|nr:PP2C family protein-serine/threonine phosphatase [Methanocorpusculum sp.]